MISQVNSEPVESVRDRRAGRAARRVIRAEHEVIKEELRSPAEQVSQRSTPIFRFEAIVFVDSNPRQLLPLPRNIIAKPGQLLLGLQEFEARFEPFLACCDLIC